MKEIRSLLIQSSVLLSNTSFFLQEKSLDAAHTHVIETSIGRKGRQIKTLVESIFSAIVNKNVQ